MAKTRALLHRHGCLPSPRCPLCDANEDLAHLFARCVRLEPLFALVEAPAAGAVHDLEGVCAALAAPLQELAPPVRHTLVLLILWVVWKSRNRKVFDDVWLRARHLATLLSEHCELWLHRLPRRLSRQPVESWLARLRTSVL
ncbi:hypothetical protein QYE76_006881 [Lolium multiflorum]|uniref:Reverse transcriptase zinc-binding domain-containing protein n=1 Tax=Lolium multiflorum TaxID=4521 RepID=A0AAD8W4S9_LOLMU|nr:hypothetical protein QYE76_006881 [Lolium multiflorum]